MPLLIETCLLQRFSVFSDSILVPLETIVQYEVAEEQWPFALNVLKHSQFPRLIVQAIGILHSGRKHTGNSLRNRMTVFW
jgi:hypothetical protein